MLLQIRRSGFGPPDTMEINALAHRFFRACVSFVAQGPDNLSPGHARYRVGLEGLLDRPA